MKKQKQTHTLTLGVRPEFIQLILYMSKVLGELPSRKPGSLWLVGPPWRVWGGVRGGRGGDCQGQVLPLGELSLTWVWSLCSFDLSHKAKERALDPGLSMRRIRCSDSSSMVQEGGQRDRQERMHQGPGQCLLGPRLWPKTQALKGSSWE